MVNRNKAFTMMEILIVVTLLGLIAVYTLPNYYKTLARSIEKDIIAQLSAIHAAQKHYFYQTGTYWGPGANTNAVNTGLGLDIISTKATFDCDAPTPTTFECHGVSTASAPFTFRVRETPLATGTNPCCESGTCPTIVYQC